MMCSEAVRHRGAMLILLLIFLRFLDSQNLLLYVAVGNFLDTSSLASSIQIKHLPHFYHLLISFTDFMGRTQEKFRCVEGLVCKSQTNSTENAKDYGCQVRPTRFSRQLYWDSNSMGSKYKEYKPGANEYCQA